MIDYRLLGKRLKKMRSDKNLTQEYIAERVDITTVYLSKIENGHVRPTLDVLDAICSVVDGELAMLFSDISPQSNAYQSDRAAALFGMCSPAVKPIALQLLEDLSKLPPADGTEARSKRN